MSKENDRGPSGFTVFVFLLFVVGVLWCINIIAVRLNRIEDRLGIQHNIKNWKHDPDCPLSKRTGATP